MSGVGGVIAGVVGLSLLELVLTRSAANGHVNGVFTIVGDVLDYWLDPTIPLIPDHSTTGSSSGTAGSVYTQPAPASGTLKHVVGDNGIST